MRGLLLLLLFAGCLPNLDGEVRPDAAAEITPDADSSDALETPRACEVELKDPTGINRGRVGASGGGMGPNLVCNDSANERVVGMAVRMSNQNTIYGARSAHGLAFECARVSVHGGTADVGTVTQVEVSGLGTYNWTPSTWTAPAMCKPGWIVSGMIVHTGTSGNLFRDVSIICSQLGDDAAPGATETIKIVGSLTDANGPTQVNCGAGEVLAHGASWTGAGFDALELSCSRPTCR